jgi:hypothetical protein
VDPPHTNALALMNIASAFDGYRFPDDILTTTVFWSI